MVAEAIALEPGWTQLKTEGIERIQNVIDGGFQVQFNADEYMNLYTVVYNMCTQRPPRNWSEQLYQRYTQSVASYLEKSVLPNIQRQHGQYMLQEMVKRFDNHQIMIKWLSRFFSYLDRFFVKRTNLYSLVDIGTKKFREIIFDALKMEIRTASLELIRNEREGEKIDRGLLKNVVEIFVELSVRDLDVYHHDFEDQFMDATAEYYSRESAKWIQEDSFPDYMKKAEERIDKERLRVSHYLHFSSEDRLMREVDKALLENCQQDLLEKETGCRALLRDNKIEDLNRMYRLFSRLPSGLTPIALMVKEHIESDGLRLVKEMSASEKVDPIDYIEKLIEMHDKYLDLVTNCLSGTGAGNAVFQKALKEGFEVFVNKNIGNSSTAEMLSQYCDHLLKTGGKKLTDEALEQTLDKIVRLFSYLTEKDLFSEFYRKQLSKRLLLQRSQSDDAERSLLQKLKLRCGAQFTSKLEGMINDMETSNRTQAAFQEWITKTDKKLPFDMQIQVLTTGFWPEYRSEDLLLPEEFSHQLEMFQAYYDSTTNGRKLRWIHNVGQVTLKGHYTRGIVEMVVSTAQAFALLLYNTHSEHTLADIQKALGGLTEDDVKRALVSLAAGKYKFLLKSPPSKELKSTDVYKFNETFKSDKRKIKVPQAVARMNAEEKETAKKTVEDDRKLAIEAAIVRVMKSRKQLEHPLLVAEVSKQVMQHFKPDPKVIKKRIEDLINRDYLERDPDNAKVYRYVA